MSPNDPREDALPPLTPEEEATMQEEIELALEPFRKLAPANMIPMLRESLERSLRTHPVPRQLLRAFAPRAAAGGTSGTEPVGGAQEDHDDKAEGKDGA
jgi:hypothetical protein